MKKIVMIVVICLPIFSIGKALPEAAAQNVSVIEVGNSMCPVTGEDISGKHFAEHEGKRYGLCCGQCVKKFNKHPKKYLAKAARDDDADSEAEGHDHHDHDHHAH